MEKTICYCKNVSEADIQAAISKGAKTLKDIQKQTGACTGNKCKELNPSGKCCSTEINALLNIGDEPCNCKCSCC